MSNHQIISDDVRRSHLRLAEKAYQAWYGGDKLALSNFVGNSANRLLAVLHVVHMQFDIEHRLPEKSKVLRVLRDLTAQRKIYKQT